MTDTMSGLINTDAQPKLAHALPTLDRN